MSHANTVRERAYLAFTQCRTVEGTARLCELSPSTIRKWKLKDDWDARLENDKALMAEDPFAENKALEQFIGQFNVAKEDAAVMRQIITLEGICFGCIKDAVPEEQLNLQPKSFKEAVDVLKVCWNMRERLLHPERQAKAGVAIQVNTGNKSDFVTGATYGEDPSKQKQEVVLRQMPDSEHNE